MVAYSFRPRFIDAIRAGLGHPMSVEAFAAGMDQFGNVLKPHPKRQTIRAVGKRRHARVGEVLQLYTGMRTKQCQSIGVAKCTAVRDIQITFGKLSGATIGGPIEFFGGNDLDGFAQRDGFANWSEMVKFWSDEHGTNLFTGLLIQWEPIR